MTVITASGPARAMIPLWSSFLLVLKKATLQIYLDWRDPLFDPLLSFLLGIRCRWYQVEVGVVSGKGRFKTLDEDAIEAHLVAINEMES